MPYAIRLPDGTLVENIPDEVTPEQAKQRILKSRPDLLEAKPVTQEQPVQKPVEESGVLRQVADVPVSIARGAAMGVRMVADAFGANNPVSNSIKSVEGYLSGLLSAQAKKDEQEVARIMKDAEDKGVLEQVKAGFRAFATAPVDLLAQGLGTAAPAIVGGLGATLLRAGAAAATATGAGIGAGMGAGAVKGQIYEGVKEALAQTGMSPEQVEARAQLAQAYGGQNLDMILAGTALGGLASATGIEPVLARQAAKSIIGRSLAGRAATTGVAEAVPEMIQGSQEQLAQNIALQREGFDVDTMRGVVGAGTLEGLAGAGLGTAVGALTPDAPEGAPPVARSAIEPEPVVPEAPVTTAAEPSGRGLGSLVADLEEDFPPLTRPTLGPVPPQAEPILAPAGEPVVEEDEAPDFESMLFDEAREYKPVADQEPSLRDAYEQKKNNWGAATQSANEALRTGDYMIFAPFQGLYPKTAKRLEVLIGASPAPAVAAPAPAPVAATPVPKEEPRGPATPEAIEAETQRPEVIDPTIPVIEDVEPPVSPLDAWNSMDQSVRLQVAEAAGLKKPENFASKKWGSLPKDARTKLSQALATQQAASEPAGEGKVRSIEEEDALQQIADLEKERRKIERNSGSLIGALRRIGVQSEDLREVYGRNIPIYAQNLRPKGREGTRISTMVSNGTLDAWLPYDQRLGAANFDPQEAEQIIKERMMQQRYLTVDTEIAMRQLGFAIEELEQALKLEDINAELEIAAQEQRDLDQEAEADAARPEDRDTGRAEEAQTGQAPDLELTPATPETFQAAEKRAAQAPKDLEADQIRRESEAGAGQFALTSEDGRQDTSGDLFREVDVRISPEQQKREALEKLESALNLTVSPFISVSSNGRSSRVKPKPLSQKQVANLLELAGDAIDLGLPASTLSGIKSAGATGMSGTAAISAKKGWLFLSKDWASSNKMTRLQALIHEIAHVIDYDGALGKISKTPEWDVAHEELRRWYELSPILHPLGYPFSRSFDKQIPDRRTESFPQSFALYFTNPDKLEKNAPKTYSQIKSLVERIQNESQRTSATGAGTTGGTGVQVQPTRSEAGAEVQPRTGEIRAGISRIEQLEDRDFESLTAADFEKEERRLAAVRPKLNIFNQTPLSQWTKPDSTKMADFVYTMQDKLVDTKDVVKAIEEQVGKIEEQWNPYLQEELYHGRTAKQTNDFLSDEMRPLVKMMERMGVTIDELDTYLHNRIAEQRNKQAAALNPKLQDGGSGIMTADARAYLAGLTKEQKAKYEQLAKKVDQISQGTRDLLVDTGLESQETVDAWEAENPNYVPLFREDVDYGVTKEVTTGLGFNTKGGTSKRFMGSQRKVVNILANIAMQRERAIVRSNKNRVAVATYGLAVKNPNPGFWLAVNPDAKNLDKVIDELMEMGLSEEDAKGVMQEPVQARIERKKNPKTGLMEEQIVYEVNPAARGKFDVFASRVNGQDRYVFFNGNDPRAARMVTALKNLDADSLGRAMGMAATITRYFAAINTQYNPIFGAFNFLRDMQGAAIQVSNTPLAGKRADILAGAFPALKGIYTSLRADTKGKTAPVGEWAKLWDEFQQEGGQTGFRDQFSRSDERAEALQDELNQIKEGKAKKSVRAIFDWLSDYNDAMENALRLSAYKAGLDKGLSKQEAASVAKNLTVNFNRKGQIGVQANALYAFFNAAVQGTARLLQTLGTVENGKFRLTKVGKTILGGGFLLGTMQALALAAAGFDDDEPPQFIRERNFIIPTGDGKYLTFPMPLGYNVIPNTSRIITEFVLSGGKDPAKRVADITTAFLDMFNPIGNAGWSAQTIAPTIADPLVALTENKDWTGKPIAREDFSNLDPTPGYTRAKETASWFSKNLSEFMNLATGGTSYQPGVFSPTPDQIDYLIGVATGGVGRELLKLEQTITGTVTGEEVPTYKIPLAGRFFGDTKAAASEANKFYTNLTELNKHENEIKGRRENKGDAAGYIRDNPEARLVTMASRIERNVQELRKKRRALVEKGAPKEAVQQIEKQITVQMKRLNDRVAKLEK
jgi:hypothetical protein